MAAVGWVCSAAYRTGTEKHSVGIDPAQHDNVLRRIIVVCTLLAAVPAGAQSGALIHATCAAQLAIDPAHVRTLRAELVRALNGKANGYTLDVSLVQLTATPVNGEIEVRAEVKTMLSDASGRVRLTSTSRAAARGPVRDRAAVHRDAVTAVAGEIAKLVLQQH